MAGSPAAFCTDGRRFRAAEEASQKGLEQPTQPKHQRHTLIADGGVGPHGDSDLSPNESQLLLLVPKPHGEIPALEPRGLGWGWGGPQPQQHLGAC